MNIADLKKLQDKEFIDYICKMQRNKSTFCIKCGKVVDKDNRRTISVSRDNIKLKKLCTLCDDCYSDLIDFIGVADVDL
ncbi:MAG: hypothetical protein IKR57_01745 [Bacilli bacterium]|nr:hypothetical protein [Bacilli bacterium]